MARVPERPVLLTRGFWWMMALAAASFMAAAVVVFLGPRLSGPASRPPAPIGRPWRADQGALREPRPHGPP